MKNGFWALLLATFLALGVGFSTLTIMPSDAVACHPDCDDDDDDDDDDSRGSHG